MNSKKHLFLIKNNHYLWRTGRFIFVLLDQKHDDLLTAQMIPQTDQRASRPRPQEDPGEVLPKYLSKLEIIKSQNSLSRKGPLKVTRSNSPTSHRDTYNSTLGWQCQEPILQSLTPHSVPSIPRPRIPAHRGRQHRPNPPTPRPHRPRQSPQAAL